MSDSSVLDLLREQFAGVHTKLDALREDVLNLKTPVNALGTESGHVRIAVAEIDGRLDRQDTRLERIERRLDLVDVH